MFLYILLKTWMPTSLWDRSSAGVMQHGSMAVNGTTLVNTSWESGPPIIYVHCDMVPVQNRPQPFHCLWLICQMLRSGMKEVRWKKMERLKTSFDKIFITDSNYKQKIGTRNSILAEEIMKHQSHPFINTLQVFFCVDFCYNDLVGVGKKSLGP